MPEAPHVYAMTPQEFLDRHLSKGRIGDIRTILMEEALKELDRIDRNKELGRAGIALLAFREENKPGSVFIPEDGLIYPLYPGSQFENEWAIMRDNFAAIYKVPGQLHAYDADEIKLPI